MGFFAASTMGSRWSWRNCKEAVLSTKTIILSLLFFSTQKLHDRVWQANFVYEFIFPPSVAFGIPRRGWGNAGDTVCLLQPLACCG